MADMALNGIWAIHLEHERRRAEICRARKPHQEAAAAEFGGFSGRNEEIVRLRDSGMTLVAIARRFKLSPERTRQIDIMERRRQAKAARRARWLKDCRYGWRPKIESIDPGPDSGEGTVWTPELQWCENRMNHG